MTVSSIYTGVNAASSTTANSKTGAGLGGMGADDFLKLMLTQMQNQDPTNPMDQKDMLAQMAQFTQLSNSTEMNSTMTAMKSTLEAIGAKLGAIDPATGKPYATTTDTGSTSGVAV
jgi:flagellar basal-body rod modification protein FlgD